MIRPMSPSVLQLVDFAPAESLSKEAQQLIDYTRRGARPKRATKDTIVEQFHETFQLMGGIPRLALWADQNPGAFFALYSKLLPAAIKAEMTTHHTIDGMTPEQLRELPISELKMLMLVKAGELAEDSAVTMVPYDKRHAS